MRGINRSRENYASLPNTSSLQFNDYKDNHFTNGVIAESYKSKEYW